MFPTRHAVDSAILKNTTMSLHGELRTIIFNDSPQPVIAYLQHRGLLSLEKNCNRCDTEMRLGEKKSITDKCIWRCKRKGCKANISVRDASYFSKSRLPLNKLLHCVYLWALETPIISASTQLGISQVTLVALYNFLREVCSTALIANPVQLGGPGRNIESYWNRNKVKLKRMKGVRRDMLAGYLDECMWRERAGDNKFDAILHEIARQYPV